MLKRLSGKTPEYATVFIILFILCLFCVILIFYSNNYDPKVAKIRRLGKRFKVVTGPQFSELYLTKEKKTGTSIIG